MSNEDREGTGLGGLAFSAPGSDIRRTCVGLTRAGAPCGSFTMAGDDYCFSHSPNITDGERKAAWRLGGLTSTAAPSEAEVPTISLRIRSEVSAAREKIYSLTLARVLSSAVASTLLAALQHADQQRDRAEALALERRPRQLATLHVEFAPWFKQLAEGNPRSLPSRPPIVAVKDNP